MVNCIQTGCVYLYIKLFYALILEKANHLSEGSNDRKFHQFGELGTFAQYLVKPFNIPYFYYDALTD